MGCGGLGEAVLLKVGWPAVITRFASTVLTSFELLLSTMEIWPA